MTETKYQAGDRVRISMNPRPAIGEYVAPSFAGAIGTIESSEATMAGSYRVRVDSLVQYVGPESLTPEGPSAADQAAARVAAFLDTFDTGQYSPDVIHDNGVAKLLASDLQALIASVQA